MMKKILIAFTIGISIITAGIVKASTKNRVYQLENQVINLSRSARKAWDTVAQLDSKLSKLERQAAQQAASAYAEGDDIEEEEAVENYGDEDEEDDYNPKRRPRNQR
jgi:hypothetical protein